MRFDPIYPVCREIVNTNYYIDIFEKRKKQYLSFRNKKIGEHLIEELGADFLAKHKINIGNVRLAYRDYKANFLNQEIKKLREYLNGFLLKFQDGILNDIHTKKNRKIHILVINLDIEIPLCLAGRGNFQVANNSEIKDIDTILNVLPYPNKTFIVAAVLSKNKSELDFYIDRFSNSLEAVNMVESWMIHGSDHWFIKPSVWDKIQRQFKNEMINDIYDFSKNIGHKYRYSIFNDIKRDFLAIADKSNKKNINPAMRKILKEERKKFTD